MDLVTSSMVSEFAAANDLTGRQESDRFEAFVAHCVLSNEFDDEFVAFEQCTGGGNDYALDSASLIVNGNLIDSVDQITDLENQNHYLEAKFVFTQAKTSQNFDGFVISTLADNLDDLFSDHPSFPMNEDIAAFRELITELFERSVSFRRGSPDLILRYATTGTWTEDPYLLGKIDSAKNRLDTSNLFGVVDIACLGAKELHALYRRSMSAVEESFEFADAIVLPEIAGVKESYIGFVPVAEYLKLITDPSGSIRRSLFYDNVRDFQDYNTVNQGIADTLKQPDQQDRFVLLK